MKNSIYIIDDDNDVRDVLTFTLESEGYHVTAFDNGSAALRSLNSIPSSDYPEVIFVDYFMPVMNGITFIQELKNSSDLCDIPIVLCSGQDVLGDQIILPEGVKQLMKPMELSDILCVAEKYCTP